MGHPKNGSRLDMVWGHRLPPQFYEVEVRTWQTGIVSKGTRKANIFFRREKAKSPQDSFKILRKPLVNVLVQIMGKMENKWPSPVLPVNENHYLQWTESERQGGWRKPRKWCQDCCLRSYGIRNQERIWVLSRRKALCLPPCEPSLEGSMPLHRVRRRRA